MSEKKYDVTHFDGSDWKVSETDPAYIDRFAYFALDEVSNHEVAGLDPRTRYLVILSTLLGCQGTELFGVEVKHALDAGVTPVEIKEVIYQGTAYLGLGRVYSALHIANDVFASCGIALPIEDQTATTLEDRLVKGNQIQIDNFGPQMKERWNLDPEYKAHINYWLADNCFGDYYTRKGLTQVERELITFCYISAQGGCEPQLTSHAMANMAMGNDRAFMVKVVSNALPYIGYPRSLNAIGCIEKAYEAMNHE